MELITLEVNIHLDGLYSGTAGTDGVATFVVPHNSPDTLYYYCVKHSGMGANIL